MTEKDAREAGLRVVPEHFKADAEAAFAKLAKRAAKRLNGVASSALVFVARGTYTHYSIGHNEHGEQVERRKQLPALFARIDGAAPKLAGWQLVARLYMTATGERMLNAVPGEDVPARFRTSGMECEHCNAARLRNDVFVVRHEGGEFKQVGRTCIRDFLGHDPARLLAGFTAVSEIGKEFDDFCGGLGGHDWPTYCTEEMLEYTAACVRVDGWTSRKVADEQGKTSTASLVRECFGRGEVASNLRKRYKPSEADAKTARDALQWVRGTLGAPSYGLSDYEHNLVASLRHAVIDGRTFGIAASAIQAYLRAMSREAELNSKREANAASVYVGAEKERLRDVPLRIEFKTLVESDFGACYLFKFRRADGCLFSWFCSGSAGEDFKAGDDCLLTGTVKAHREYKGTKETQLTRCKLAHVKTAEAA